MLCWGPTRRPDGLRSDSPLRWPARTGHSNCDDGSVSQAAVRRTDGVDYGPGQLLDLYQPEHARGSVAVLLWHGRGANERDVLGPLAHQIAGAGVPTIVPDWSSDDGGRGRHHLTASLAFTHDLAEATGFDRIVLAGWSLGANAGLDVVLLSSILGGWRPAAFIGLSGSFDDSPYRDGQTFDLSVDPTVPLLLIHGASDEVVPVERARMTAERLVGAGWKTSLREVETDHAGSIGAVYDPDTHRCVPTDDPIRGELLASIGGWMADFALHS
jgi:pimeloyl-ACP methyl ester carboxylesterase